MQKKINVFKLASFLAIIPEILETHAHKKFNLQHKRVIKIPQNAVFRLNRKLKCNEIQKLLKILAKLKCRENFLP